MYSAEFRIADFRWAHVNYCFLSKDRKESENYFSYV